MSKPTLQFTLTWTTRMTAAVLVPCAVGTLLLAACGKSEPATSTPAAQAPQSTSGSQTPTAATKPDLAYHMQESFWAAVEARDAIIDGNLQQAREHSAVLSKQGFTALPDRWKHWIAEMQKNAGDAAVAADIDEAAQWVAALGLTCGNCHWYSGDGPKFGLQHGPEAAPAPEDIQTRMLRHAHAADDLWMGLVMASDAAWQRGATRLNETPPERPLKDGEAVNAHFAEQLNAIKALGLRAQMAKTPVQRAEVYGSLIARCAHCHAVVER